ncbi:UTRA domain-containing protein [Streptomyces sp. SID13666]|nr:UTRA domain-containing protein [Streptomyces sp. SID13666]NEA73954.1 UTRA domain-containing protein [Streptomyces sp. SID13588]
MRCGLAESNAAVGVRWMVGERQHPSPARATQAQANLLGISVGDMVLEIERTYYDTEGRPVETADIVIPDVRWEIAYEIAIEQPWTRPEQSSRSRTKAPPSAGAGGGACSCRCPEIWFGDGDTTRSAVELPAAGPPTGSRTRNLVLLKEVTVACAPGRRQFRRRAGGRRKEFVAGRRRRSRGRPGPAGGSWCRWSRPSC